jgi:hypothetical protein
MGKRGMRQDAAFRFCFFSFHALMLDMIDPIKVSGIKKNRAGFLCLPCFVQGLNSITSDAHVPDCPLPVHKVIVARSLCPVGS